MSTSKPFNPVSTIAKELSLPERSVAAVATLLAENSTVPFIARYRKEVTGNLDEVQIRTILERRQYLLELDERRQVVLASIQEQGKLTEALKAKISACESKATLEDLYLPYKPKRRTRAIIAKEQGLGPLADRILAQPADGDPLAEAAVFVDVDKKVATAQDALRGAQDIVAELGAELAEVRAFAREMFAQEGVLVSAAVTEKTQTPTKFEQYYDFSEAVATIPSHRFLAIRRGEREGILRMHIAMSEERITGRMRQLLGHNPESPFSAVLAQAAEDGYRRLLAPSVETDIRVDLKMRADRDAVEVFASNLRNLLLAAPLGGKNVVGVDPGLRTGCKCVALSATGKFLDNTTFYLTKGENKAAEARDLFLAFVKKHAPICVAIGNGTGGRETETFVRQLLRENDLALVLVVAVNEAGASVYSASDTARDEFPNLDITVRGAISIGRRLQDPLAELVKIDPKAIGVGQYQHDVHQPLLQRKLDDVVESCVNHVGVELNTASVSLLARVAGIGPSLARKIVGHRESVGPFLGRQGLLEVAGMGPRTYEQAAGFLRIHGGTHPLDASAVHPERYDLVSRMANDLKVAVAELVGNVQAVKSIDIGKYVSPGVGEPTLRDIVDELKKPGRDPRAEFSPPKFRDDVSSLAQLKVGMSFEGVVTNVTAFGAFVDIGVHQDGLVHISALSDKFVKDPHDVVRVGQKLQVRVIEVDVTRQRIGLTARREVAEAGAGQTTAGPGNKGSPTATSNKGPRPGNKKAAPNKFANNPFAKLRLP